MTKGRKYVAIQQFSVSLLTWQKQILAEFGFDFQYLFDKLLAMRDVNVRITVLCLLDREGCMSDNECWEAGFSARMLPEFIAEKTGEVIVSKSFNDRTTEEEEDLDCSICGIDDFYEAGL